MSPTGPDLRHVEHWVFDLDNTLYPRECELMALVEGRITEFVVRESGLPTEEALALQKRYLHEHGTSLAGLMAHHDVDPYRFLDEVHDVSLECLRPDPVLRRGLQRLPGRRLVFTNGSARHAERVLERLAIADLFDDVFHLEAANLIPKPDPRTFQRMADRHGVAPRAAAFFEDTEKNLAPAAALGMTTVLVGPHAPLSTAGFVDHKTERLPDFLTGARTKDPA